MQAMSGYKPSPLGYGSPRTSPFRRPESPASPSPLRQTTPSASPTKLGSMNSATRLTRDSTPTTTESWTPRGSVAPNDDTPAPLSPQRTRTAAPSMGGIGSSHALSQLQPTQVRNLRDGFQILDRDSDGVVTRDDVADMLGQLGLPSGPVDVSQFFPPSAPQNMTLAAFLNTMATTLAALSDSSELLSALSAFDDDDNGQIDAAELRDALLHTAPEPGELPLSAAEVDKVLSGFTGRRAFNKNLHGAPAKRGEVFKYRDFVNSITGTGAGSEPAAAEGAEDTAA